MENETEKRIDNYPEFWDFYVLEHSQPLTRILHLIGTVSGLVLLAWIVWSRNWIYLPLVLVVGYAFAWFAHFVVEKNKPATFKYPGWSFISDYKMVFYMLTGRMNTEVERVSRK
ncbi:MAG: Mpo1-like protein [Pyrinomonadaceae bacterium]